MKRVAVIAGTPVDTQMGVGYIEKKNEETGLQICEPVYLPVAVDCDAQMRFQYSDYSEKRIHIDRIFDSEIEKGTRDFFIYCNSLSGAFDFDEYVIEKNEELREKAYAETAAAQPADAKSAQVVPTFADPMKAKSVQADPAAADPMKAKSAQADPALSDPADKGAVQISVYTPIQVYRKLGAKYKCLGVMAAHNLSAHAIEKALMSSNPGIYVIGAGNMSVVRAIEEGKSPADITEEFRLADMCSYMKASGAESVILGCTHFPYFKNELAKYTDLPIIDPADEMFASMM